MCGTGIEHFADGCGHHQPRTESGAHAGTGDRQTCTQCTAHTVHLPLGALLSPCTMCGAGRRVTLHVATCQEDLRWLPRCDTYPGLRIRLVHKCSAANPGFKRDEETRLLTRLEWNPPPYPEGSRAAHGPLPHRAPSPRCTAESVHHVWW